MPRKGGHTAVRSLKEEEEEKTTYSKKKPRPFIVNKLALESFVAQVCKLLFTYFIIRLA